MQIAADNGCSVEEEEKDARHDCYIDNSFEYKQDVQGRHARGKYFPNNTPYHTELNINIPL